MQLELKGYGIFGPKFNMMYMKETAIRSNGASLSLGFAVVNYQLLQFELTLSQTVFHFPKSPGFGGETLLNDLCHSISNYLSV